MQEPGRYDLETKNIALETITAYRVFVIEREKLVRLIIRQRCGGREPLYNF